MYSVVVLFFLLSGIHTSFGSLESNNVNSTTTDVTNISELSAELYYDNISTTLNTTDFPTTTPTKSSVKLNKPKMIIENYRNEINCSCNLHIDACDIGCCCDKDCTYEMRKIFERCEEVTEHLVDRSACQYFETYYLNYTAHEWEFQNNDFLCVEKSNMPPSYAVQKDKPFRSYTDTISYVKTGHFWANPYMKPPAPLNYSKPYIQGVPLKYIRSNSTVDIFKLNEAFFSSACDHESNILYLHDFDRECVQILDEKSNHLNADFFRSLLFVAKPNELNATKFRNALLICPEPVCLKPVMRICSDKSLRNCSDSNKKGVLDLRCSKKNSHFFCENIVDSFKILIDHEGIQGIKNITIFIHQVNVTSKNTDLIEINQHLSVAYEWSSVELKISDILSGNPGYLTGKPILIASLVNGSVSRKSDNYPENFLCLPHEDGGVCKIGEFAYQPIEFGFNTILLCKVKGSLHVANVTQPIDICKTMQVDIMKYWSIKKVEGNFISRIFGLFGNANSSLIDEWANITFEKSPNDVLKNITGFFTNKNETLECNDFVFGLNINILHAKIDLKKLMNQEKILGITYQFHSGINKSLEFDIKDGLFFYEFDMDTRITFWDITSRKLKKLSNPPSLNIELPSDFFYPFVKMGNASMFIAPQFSFVIILICSIELFI